MSTPHNPDHLSDEQIGIAEGWRLLDRDECGEWIPQTQFRDGEEWSETGSWCIGNLCAGRTKLTRSELRAARRPKPSELNPPAETSDIGSFSSLAAAFIDAWEAMCVSAHKQARKSGFYDDADKLQALADAHGLGIICHKMRGAQLNALIQSEGGEALEGMRKDLPSDKCPGFTNEEEEYADQIIRIMDMAQARGLRIGQCVPEKMRVNAGRERMHGGKKF